MGHLRAMAARRHADGPGGGRGVAAGAGGRLSGTNTNQQQVNAPEGPL